MTAPTPDPLAGPWILSTEGAWHEIVVRDAHGNLVVRCEKAVANAQAISAVPEAMALAQWIDHHFDNQDMSHVDFRIEAAKLTRDYLAKARGA